MRDIGDRMKASYELRSRHYLTSRVPVVVRVDGRAFHTYTRGMDRPFDGRFMDAMVSAAREVAGEMQGFKAAYIQSDEASFLLTDYDTLDTSPWFGYVQSKVETISASIMTAAFNRIGLKGKDAHFDARAFNVPREEVVNYFLWRAKDWERNSLAMYCGSFFSHKEMHGKNAAAQHEMLHGIGKNWAENLSCRAKNGTWIIAGNTNESVRPAYEDIANVLDGFIYCDKMEKVF